MKVALKTLTPIHVGNGDDYSYGDAYVDSQGILHRCEIDYSKVNVQEIIDNMENSYYIQKILREYGKDIYTAKCRANLSFTGTNIKEVANRRVREFIKDGTTPYIPGSSVKGAIRTILYAYYLHKRNFMVETPLGERNFIDLLRNGLKLLQISPLGRDREDRRDKYFGKRFEQLVFTYSSDPKNWRDAKYDIMKFVEISDFYPVKHNYNLYVDAIKTYSKGPRDIYPKPFTVYAETVEGEFQGAIRISPAIQKVLKSHEKGILERKLDILGLKQNDLELSEEEITRKFLDYLKEATKYFYELCMDHDYIETGLKHPENVKKCEFKLRVGFGVGTHYQTILKLLETSNQNIVKNIILQNRLTKYAKLYPQIPYPKTFEVIEYDGKKLPLGWMEVIY